MRSSRILLILFVVCIALGVQGQSKARAGKLNDPVAKIGTSVVTLEEYEKMHAKSLGTLAAAKATSLSDREKFLDLIVNYKLKLMDAYKKGLDKRPEILNELNQYRGSLAESFLVEREITTPGIHRLYDRRGEEIRAEHILLSLDPKASSADSIAAYDLAKAVLQRLKAGDDFGTLALQFSKDPSVKQNRGDLYFFTAGQMVSAFEDAVYNLKVGQITEVPVRTQFGLHIIKVLSRGPSRGEIQVSHIMVRFNSQNPTPEDTLAAYKKIVAYQDTLKAGGDFAALAERHSEDPGSSSKGGDLGFFPRRRWVMPFDEEAFLLKVGEISKIVRSPYGYHLIKCTGQRPRQGYDEAKTELGQIYQQLHGQEDFTNYLNALKAKFGYQRDGQVAEKFFASLDTNKTVRDSAWYASIPKSVGASTLISFGKRTVTVDSIVSLLRSRAEFGNTVLRKEALLPVLDKIAELLTFGLRSELLEADNAEFASIMREYKEGVLLYQVEQDNVWSKIAANDSLLHLFFGKHRDMFTYPDRVNGTEIRSTNTDAINRVYSLLQKGESMETIAREDSIRMARPSSFPVVFTRGSTSLPSLKKVIAGLEEMQNDSTLMLRLTAYPDTLKNKDANAALALRRLVALNTELVKKLKIDPKRVTISNTNPVSAKLQNTVTADLVGRQALVSGKPAQFLLPKIEELAQAADTLAKGGFSRPFQHGGFLKIVRLNGQEPARQKTFEEAGPEVSSAFQESESERLSKLWIDGLKKQYPVVKYPELLKEAFAEAH